MPRNIVPASVEIAGVDRSRPLDDTTFAAIAGAYDQPTERAARATLVITALSGGAGAQS